MRPGVGVGVVVFVVAVAGELALSSCGIAPVSTTPQPPPSVTYVDAHGRPRAYGGGVCPVQERHAHSYPAVPAAAFELVDGAFVDVRRIATFAGAHRWRGRTCPLTSLHQHALSIDGGDDVDATTPQVTAVTGSPATRP